MLLNSFVFIFTIKSCWSHLNKDFSLIKKRFIVMKRSSIAVLLTSVLFFFSAVFAQEDNSPDSIIIKLKVTNATAQGSTVASDTAFITFYDNHKEIDTIEAPVDESGMAVFEYQLGKQHLLALPRVRHQDMMFSGPAVHLHASPDPIQAKVEVYDVSDDNSGLTVGVHHLIIKQMAGNILVTEFMQLKNTTDKAITSDNKDALNRSQVITISLPAGFQNFKTSKYFETQALVMTENGFYDTMAIPPGTYDAKFSYTIPITAKEMQISKKVSMPTTDVMIFSQLKSGQLQGLGTPAGNFTMEDGTPAEYFMLSKKSSGDQINISLTGLKTASSKTMIIIIAVVLLLIAPLVLIRLSPSKSAEGNAGNENQNSGS